MPNPLGVMLRGRRAGQQALVWARADLQAPENFSLTSNAFGHGQPIPERYKGKLRGANISPPLAWTPPPAGTAELALIVQDPDVPFGKPAVHALVLGIDPAAGSLAENALASPSPVAGICYGKGALGRQGWAGPLPIRSHGPHWYVFQLFALSQPAGLSGGCTLDQVTAAITGHLAGRARLDGSYEIR